MRSLLQSSRRLHIPLILLTKSLDTLKANFPRKSSFNAPSKTLHTALAVILYSFPSLTTSHLGGTARRLLSLDLLENQVVVCSGTSLFILKRLEVALGCYTRHVFHCCCHKRRLPQADARNFIRPFRPDMQGAQGITLPCFLH